ncbi:MAG: 4'-phosphopantetheinyl transferase superfamily protein, partial [Chthoniobacteraceae bacterium]|nr:4'-phosphopantetheinyl transferase superfamily protein [Chthoniobacteraceae bacterium]
LAADREVGIDLESADAVADWRTHAPAVCSSREIRILSALPEAERNAAFLRLWTRKEAVLKAAGLGLGSAGVPPATVEFPLDRPFWEVSIPAATGRPSRWRVADISPPHPGQSGALAWEA